MAGEAPSVIVFGPFAWREVDRQWWIKARAKAAAELERGHVDTDKQRAASWKRTVNNTCSGFYDNTVLTGT